MSAFDHSIGPLGPNSGYSHTHAWRDENGFHRFYAVGYESREIAKLEAIENAKLLGYVPRKWWLFWR